MPEGKQKLTLTVDGELVEAAHKLDLNISELTEQVLRGYTFDPAGIDSGATREQYRDLIETMNPLLEKYRCPIVVGDVEDTNIGDSLTPVFYAGRGQYYTLTEIDEDESGAIDVKVSADPKEVHFLGPTKILKNFFAAIEKAKTQRKEEIEGLAVAKRIVEVLTERESLASRARQAVEQVTEVEEAASELAATASGRKLVRSTQGKRRAANKGDSRRPGPKTGRPR
jgi:Post-segregation antitoxin CcdA